MTNPEQQSPNEAGKTNEAVGCTLIALLFALCWGAAKLLPDMRGGLLAYLIVPPLLLGVWGALSAIVANYFLIRSNGQKPVAASIGCALLIIVAICFGLSLIDRFNQPTYHGP
jgi:hypothetical protein